LVKWEIRKMATLFDCSSNSIIGVYVAGSVAGASNATDSVDAGGDLLVSQRAVLAPILDTVFTFFNVVSIFFNGVNGCKFMPYWYGQELVKSGVKSEATDAMFKQHKYTDIVHCVTTTALTLLTNYVLPAPLSVLNHLSFTTLSFAFYCNAVVSKDIKTKIGMKINAMLQAASLGLQIGNIDVITYAHLLPGLLSPHVEACIAGVALVAASFASYKLICELEKACIESVIGRQT
jgi:hypothetical protein